jgi:rRNA maturation endonuclease Nob1
MARQFFDRLGQNIKEIVDTAGDALGDVGRVAEEKMSDSRVKYQIRQLEAEIKRVERDIGMKFVLQAKKENIDLAAFEAELRQIDKLNDEIRGLKASLGQEEVEGEGYCFVCGARNPEDAKFCQNCGAKLEIIRQTYSQTFTQEEKSEEETKPKEERPTYVNLGKVDQKDE